MSFNINLLLPFREVLIINVVPYVIGMSQSIGDRAAIIFATSFYDGLGAGQSIDFAYKLACNALEIAGSPESLTPTLKVNEKLIQRDKRSLVHQQYDR